MRKAHEVILSQFKINLAMYKIYQLQKKNYITDNHHVKAYYVKMNIIGEYSETKECKDSLMLVESVWDACNVSSWNSDWKDGEVVKKENITFYPNSNFNGYCNSDIVVESQDGLYLAEMVGWKKVIDLEEATYRVLWRDSSFDWNKIINKEDFDLTKLMEMGERINKELEEEN